MRAIFPIWPFSFFVWFYRMAAVGAPELEIAFCNLEVHRLCYFAQRRSEIDTDKAFGEKGH
jgi:hypothetical protein